MTLNPTTQARVDETKEVMQCFIDSAKAALMKASPTQVDVDDIHSYVAACAKIYAANVKRDALQKFTDAFDRKLFSC